MGGRHTNITLQMPRAARDREKLSWQSRERSITETILLLGGAVVAAPLFKRIGLGTVLGYLAAGVAIGPAARLITDGEEILPSPNSASCSCCSSSGSS